MRRFALDSSDIKNYALIKEFKTPEAAVEIFVSALIAADKNTLRKLASRNRTPSITQVLESPIPSSQPSVSCLGRAE